MFIGRHSGKTAGIQICMTILQVMILKTIIGKDNNKHKSK